LPNKPSVRARNALIRLSRDRYIPPDETRRIVRCLTLSNSAYKSAIEGFEWFGIVRGVSPSCIAENYDGQVFEIASSKNDDITKMIIFLKLIYKNGVKK
jgi:hypothetical protein